MVIIGVTLSVVGAFGWGRCFHTPHLAGIFYIVTIVGLTCLYTQVPYEW